MATLLASAGTVAAQEVDDMYFNARDRVVHAEATRVEMAMRYASADKQEAKENPVNPSDSYTGRGVNPEYSAQQKNGAEIVQGAPDYFLAAYKPKDINSNQYTGSSNTSSICGCNSFNSFGYPYNSYYSPYGMYSPYSTFGSMYTPFGMGYGPAWSLGMMYGGIGYPAYGMYNPYGYYPIGPAYAYDPIQTTYGRRALRGGSVASSFAYANPGYAAGTNGRNRAVGQQRTQYYDATWRNNPGNFSSRGYNNGGRSAFSPWSQSGTGTRTRTYDSFGSGTRSMGMPGGGAAGGGGRSRGRN